MQNDRRVVLTRQILADEGRLLEGDHVLMHLGKGEDERELQIRRRLTEDARGVEVDEVAGRNRVLSGHGFL